MERNDRLTPHDISRIAVEAHVCDRTVRRYFAGGKIKPSGRARIEDALGRLGYACATANSPAEIAR